MLVQHYSQLAAVRYNSSHAFYKGEITMALVLHCFSIGYPKILLLLQLKVKTGVGGTTMLEAAGKRCD